MESPERQKGVTLTDTLPIPTKSTLNSARPRKQNNKGQIKMFMDLPKLHVHRTLPSTSHLREIYTLSGNLMTKEINQYILNN